MTDTFTLLCHHGYASAEGQPEFIELHEFTSCSHALRNAQAFIRRNKNTTAAEAEIWLNRTELLWDSREPWRGSWEGPQAIGLYATTFPQDENGHFTAPSYKLVTSRPAA